jgi:cytochrome c oxidase subunit 1
VWVFVIKTSQTIDIHLHDTYYIIALSHVLWAFAFLLMVLWILYRLTHKILYSRKLTWTHIVVSLLTVLLLCLFISNNLFDSQSKRYIDLSSWTTFSDYQQTTRMLRYTVAGLLLGQLLFIINLIAGITKRFTK